MIKVSDMIKIQGLDEKKKKSLSELINDPYVRDFLTSYKLSSNVLNNYWIEFLDYRDDKKTCDNCKGLSSCPKENKGMVKNLEMINSEPTLTMSTCEYYLKSQEVLNHFVYKTNNYSDELLLTDFETLLHNNRLSKEGSRVCFELMAYLSHPDKGLFLHGENENNDQTLLMAGLMNSFARQGNDVGFIHFPTFIINLKNSFNSDDPVDISILYDLPYLFIDGLGEENVTPYSRDEVLLTILSNRAINELPTFITSLFDYEELRRIYYIRKGDELKVKLLLHKMKMLTKEIKVN